MRSRDFRYWLAGRYYDETAGAPGGQALADALGVLEQMAIRGPEHQPHLRVAGADGKVYLDLGDPSWRAVEVTAEGWAVIAKPPVKFTRSRAMPVLPGPAAGASIGALYNFINVASEHDFRLLVGFLVGVLRPDGPHPILCLAGEPRTGKTMIAQMLAGLVDPRRAALRSLPKDPRDLAIAAFNGRLLLFDNISHLPEELADALCRLSSGTGFATRALHSDRDETIFDGARPIVLNGIPNVAATRADLADRALTITLAPIAPEAGRSESALFADFEAARPEILGAILTAVSSALRNAATVEIAHHERMIDFSIWVTAAEAGLGWAPGTFVAAYRANQAGNVELAVEADTVASAVVALCERVILPWEGNASELLAELELEVKEKVRASRAWPGNASALGNRLRRCAPVLRAIGIEVEFGDRASTKDRKRLVVIRRRG